MLGAAENVTFVSHPKWLPVAFIESIGRESLKLLQNYGSLFSLVKSTFSWLQKPLYLASISF